MSDNLYSYQFNAHSNPPATSFNQSSPPSYEEATNTETPVQVEFPEPMLIFPDPNYPTSPPPSTHTININDIPIKSSTKGVVSHEALLNKDPDLLHHFFLHHNTLPNVFIDIHGYHFRRVVEEYRTQNENGETVVKTRTYQKQVTDFQFSYDLSEYVLPPGTLHLMNPEEEHSHGEDCNTHSLNQLFISYTQSKNRLKEIQLEKIIQWNFEELSKAISYSIRNNGYYNTINITYRRQNHKVKVLSESKLSKFYHNKITSVFCVLTCCCLIWWPIGYLYKDKIGANFRSTFQMSISPKEWYYKNISCILNSARERRIQYNSI